tara:strand:- start:5419 stop:5718 length:300 start_codon:yes stop_codon:yes gene_type:complete
VPNNLTWEWVQNTLIKFLRDKAVKQILKAVLGSVKAGGIKVWIIKYIATELFDEVAKPFMQYVFRRAGYTYDVKKGEHVLKRIEDAKDIDAWSDAVNKS